VSCPENETLLHGYLDGELDLVSVLRFEAHLRECASCARAYETHKVLSRTLKSGPFYFRPSGDLEERIRTALAESNPAASRPTGSAQKATWRKLPSLSWAFLGVAASVAAVALVALRLVTKPQIISPDQLLAQEVLASHVRSPSANWCAFSKIESHPRCRLEFQSLTRQRKPSFPGNLTPLEI